MSEAFEIPSSQRDPSLPMIVNLRGDEDLVDHFTIDAEEAMEILGIKRSRLTQISGRELRVGRIRRDRYLRPVYRQEDIRDYQEWTRATATHQSSSRALEQAIDSLDDRFNDLFVVLQEKWQQGQSIGQEEIQRGLSSIKKLLQGEHQGLRNTLLQNQDELHALLNLSLNQLPRLLTKQDEARQRDGELIRNLEQRFQLFYQDLRELVTALVLLRKDTQETHAIATDTRRQHKELQSFSQSAHEDLLERLAAFELTITKSRLEEIEAQQRLALEQIREELSRPQSARPRRTLPLKNIQRKMPYYLR